MGFWDVVDHLVGFIPVVGTVKDAIEAAVEEAKGHHAEARQKIIEAGVGLVTDILTVASLGTATEVSVAGKVAAEEFIQQVTKGVVKVSVPELGELAAGSAAIIITAYETAQAAKRRRPGRYSPEDPDKEPSKPSKRGEHVINNGVNRIYHDILDNFFEAHRTNHFAGKTYEELLTEGIINEADTPSLISSYNQSLHGDISIQIERMVVYISAGHTDVNATAFGAAKAVLLMETSNILDSIIHERRNRNAPSLMRGELHFLNQTVNYINQGPVGNGVYVDEQAHALWPNVAQFENCRDHVRQMFNSLAGPRLQENHLLYIWANEMHRVQLRLSHQGRRLEPQTFNPISLIQFTDKSNGRAPDNTIKLGHQTDGSGDYWSAVAKTKWGTIPGKARVDSCWFPYNCREYKTKQFCWLTSARPVQLTKNTGRGVPAAAIECGYQTDGAGYHYAAIANTEWGKIPGKAKDSTCWYPYGDNEYCTSNFYWIVRN